jgi:hypothetical protein
MYKKRSGSASIAASLLQFLWFHGQYPANFRLQSRLTLNIGNTLLKDLLQRLLVLQFLGDLAYNAFGKLSLLSLLDLPLVANP